MKEILLVLSRFKITESELKTVSVGFGRFDWNRRWNRLNLENYDSGPASRLCLVIAQKH